MQNVEAVVINELMGHVLTGIDQSGDEIVFHRQDGAIVRMFHSQDCCESVTVDDVDGDLDDLIGSPILEAEEVCSCEPQPGQPIFWTDESFTWTFYKLSTIKGSVSIRWFGESNGYYSESVDIKVTGAPAELAGGES